MKGCVFLDFILDQIFVRISYLPLIIKFAYHSLCVLSVITLYNAFYHISRGCKGSHDFLINKGVSRIFVFILLIIAALVLKRLI